MAYRTPAGRQRSGATNHQPGAPNQERAGDRSLVGRVCREALRMEARRLRTRNALVHGGPLAPATVEAVAAFAEHLAGEALAACIEGRLLGNDLTTTSLIGTAASWTSVPGSNRAPSPPRLCSGRSSV